MQLANPSLLRNACLVGDEWLPVGAATLDIRNPATGEHLILRQGRVVTFKCSGKLRNKINGAGNSE